MSQTKAITDFSRYAGPDLTPVAQGIHDALAKNIAAFPNLPLSPVELAVLLDTFDKALVKKASRATDDLRAYNLARHALEGALSQLGDAVNAVAAGDPETVALSGFPTFSTARAPRHSPPHAPTDLRLSHGDLSGEITARYHPEYPGSLNELQTNAGDPNNEAGWVYAGTRNTSKATLGGHTPGTVVWVRVRSAGKDGEMGPWSTAAQIRVL